MRFERQQGVYEYTTFDDLEPYSVVASEYYDRHRHPTCWNFRQASVLFLKGFLRDANVVGARVLEVGAGRSIFCDIESANFFCLNQVTITDRTENMLQYSSSLSKIGAKLSTLDAENFAENEATFDLIICSLGDPYNTLRFWTATATRLAAHGRVVFTTPSRKWAKRYRQLEGQMKYQSADFLLQTGRLVSVPSLIVSKGDQIKLAASASLKFLDYAKVPLRAVREEPISSKLTSVLKPSDEILEAYVFRKQPEA